MHQSILKPLSIAILFVFLIFIFFSMRSAALDQETRASLKNADEITEGLIQAGWSHKTFKEERRRQMTALNIRDQDFFRPVKIETIAGVLLLNHIFRPLVCYTETMKGDISTALGAWPSDVQRMAYFKCRMRSMYCENLGCERL